MFIADYWSCVDVCMWYNMYGHHPRVANTKKNTHSMQPLVTKLIFLFAHLTNQRSKSDFLLWITTIFTVVEYHLTKVSSFGSENHRLNKNLKKKPALIRSLIRLTTIVLSSNFWRIIWWNGNVVHIRMKKYIITLHLISLSMFSWSSNLRSAEMEDKKWGYEKENFQTHEYVFRRNQAK